MSRKLEVSLLVSIIVTLAFRSLALELPYEVLDTIMELTNLDPDFAELNRVNVSDDLGPTRPIYRLDLDPNYVAYYEIDMGSDYVVLSSGSKTGDHRKVESGPDPRPTDVLLQQAQDHGQRCEKFYRLSPMGLTVCTNDNGTVVAATYNWTADIAQIENWRELGQMVNQSLDEFKSLWQERAVQRLSILDWATTSVYPKREGKEKDESAGEEALSPNSIVKVALGEHFRSVDLHITNSGDSSLRAGSKSEWQRRLCKVLVDVCMPDGGTKVNPSAIRETPNHLFYLKLEVQGNRTFVGNILQWKEIGFVVEIRGRKTKVVRKHFAMDLHSKRSRRSAWNPTGGGYRGSGGRPGYVVPVSIPYEHELPDYNQHKCCGCVSGCSPVAWAQVFAYYDRLGSYRYTTKFSGNIYRDRRTELPRYMTYSVRRFVEEIRSEIQTHCDDGAGATYTDRQHLIESWFKARQGSRATVVSYLESRKRRGTIKRVQQSGIESKAAGYIHRGYPVIISYYASKKIGHSAVATKYKEWSRNIRFCRSWTTGWWTGKKTRKSCTRWYNEYKYDFYLRYGAGGYKNQWLSVSPYIFGAHVAYIKEREEIEREEHERSFRKDVTRRCGRAEPAGES